MTKPMGRSALLIAALSACVVCSPAVAATTSYDFDRDGRQEAALVAGAEAASPAPHAVRQPGLIAYKAFGRGIFTIRPDGADNREIVREASDPVWSPDGTRLLYQRTEGDASSPPDGLWSSRPDGSDERLVIAAGEVRTVGDPCDTLYGAIDGTWAESGRRLAFVAYGDEDANGRSPLNICTAAVDRSAVRRLRRGREPDWFPGGRRIAFIAFAKSRDSFSTRVAIMRSDGRRLRVLVGDAKAYRYNLDVSPDGRRLAFLEDKPAFGPDSLTSLRVMDLRTRRIRNIPETITGRMRAAGWTPGGTRIAYVVTPPAFGPPVLPSTIFTIRPDGTGNQRLLTLPFEEQSGLRADALSWQPPQ